MLFLHITGVYTFSFAALHEEFADSRLRQNLCKMKFGLCLSVRKFALRCVALTICTNSQLLSVGDVVAQNEYIDAKQIG